MNRLITVGVIVFIFVLSIQAELAKASVRSEKAYQIEWCQGKGQTEYVLPDRTRCDCLTDTHAIEFDFGKKWAEAIGQSLYYSLQTGKRAGVVLIAETKADHKFFIRLNSTVQCFNLPIDTWIIGAGAK